MSKDYTKTVRIRKTEKVAPDERGRTVWLGKVEAVELELMSTTALEKILKSDDGKTQSEIRRLVAGKKDGVLARDTATGLFRIVSEADLQNALPPESSGKPKRGAEVTAEPISDKTRRAADELSFVNTQILKKILRPDSTPVSAKPKAGKKDKFGGFDPYDNS